MAPSADPRYLDVQIIKNKRLLFLQILQIKRHLERCEVAMDQLNFAHMPFYAESNGLIIAYSQIESHIPISSSGRNIIGWVKPVFHSDDNCSRIRANSVDAGSNVINAVKYNALAAQVSQP